MTHIKVVFGDARSMKEVPDRSVHLVVTSPPYYNSLFDFPDFFSSYDEFLSLLRDVGKEVYRVLKNGRMACFVISDVRIDGKLYPITADLISIMREIGFEYLEKIIWKKQLSRIKISHRSGVLLQHPYPLYFYPDNVYEEIIIFKKSGEFDKTAIPTTVKEKSKININRFQREKWYLSIWEITSVLPQEKWCKYTAAFPEEIEIIVREDAKRLRTRLRKEIEKNLKSKSVLREKS